MSDWLEKAKGNAEEQFKKLQSVDLLGPAGKTLEQALTEQLQDPEFRRHYVSNVIAEAMHSAHCGWDYEECDCQRLAPDVVVAIERMGYAIVKVGEVPGWMEEQHSCDCGVDIYFTKCQNCEKPAQTAYVIKAEPAHRSNAWGEG